MMINDPREVVLPINLSVGLINYSQFRDLFHDYATRVQKLLDTVKASTDPAKIKNLDPELTTLKSEFKKLEQSSQSLPKATVFFTLTMSTLFADNSHIKKLLGFTTRAETYNQFPDQKITFLPITPKLGREMGLLKSLNVTLSADDPAKTILKYGNEFKTTLVYNLEKPLHTLIDDLVGISVEIPSDKDTDPTKISYRIFKATEVKARNNIFLV